MNVINLQKETYFKPSQIDKMDNVSVSFNVLYNYFFLFPVEMPSNILFIVFGSDTIIF